MRTFSLNGPGMKAVQQSVSGLQRRGYTTTVTRHGDVDPAHFDELSADASRWRGDGGDERVSPWRSAGWPIRWTRNAYW